jgi:pyridoxamine 5'-phosphate oxidase
MASTADPGLREEDVDPDPIVQFQRWFDDARAAGGALPEAVALATASADAMPSVRMVLLKGVDSRGFVFFTNYESLKGRELAANPRAALCFYWNAFGRQVRVSGTITRVTSAESDAYFNNRPRESQLSAAVSRQSDVIPNRRVVEQQVEALRKQLGSNPVPRPPFWGGFRLEPSDIEFWLHRDNRLHDRLRYTREGSGGWRLERLSP